MAEQSILLIEDEDAIALAIEYLIRRRGFHFRRLKLGSQAMAVITEERPNCVILDVILPDASGYAICQQIKAASSLLDTKIVMMTARSGKLEREKCLALGADAFFAKPFSTIDLTNSVSQLLDEAVDVK